MSLKDLVKIMFSCTVICLIYIHLQMSIVQLAYQAKKRENVMHQLIEENSMLTSDILRLKSSNNLGVNVVNKPGMQFLASKDVVEVRTAAAAFQPNPVMARRPAEEKANALLSFIFFRSQAEAKPAE